MFYKFYEYLNRFFKLSFEDIIFEKKFQEAHLKDNIKQNLLAIKIALIAYVIYYFVAYFATPEDFIFNAYFTLPIPIILSILFLLTTNEYNVNKNHLFKLFIFAIGMGFPPVMNIAITDYYQQMYITNFMLPIFGAFVMYGAPFVIPTLSTLFLLFVFAITLILFPLEASEVLYALFLILTTFMISAVSGYLIEKSKRKNYFAVFIQEELNTQLRLEQEKNIQKEKMLQQQARLAQMGEMISMIAHQWRQPLGAISSAVIGIQTKQASKKYDLRVADDREQFLEFINKKHQNINEYVQILSSTIDDFRNFFKPDKDKELTPLNVPIKRALRIVQTSMSSKNINIITEFNNDDSLLMYPNEMMQVILNILKNSEDNFIEKNIPNAEICITCKKNKNNYTISISDNGGGISEDILSKIFDPYFSTKDEKNGTGLGLYMSKTMVEEHHNAILHVRNTNNGVCFTISLGSQI